MSSVITLVYCIDTDVLYVEGGFIKFIFVELPHKTTLFNIEKVQKCFG